MFNDNLIMQSLSSNPWKLFLFCIFIFMEGESTSYKPMVSCGFPYHVIISFSAVLGSVLWLNKLNGTEL